MTDSNKGLRILIIEDNPGDQHLIAELLDASVIKIQLLTRVEALGKAVDIIQKETFDIILLDLSLPDSSGIETFITLKKVAGKIPVIILSGLTDMNIAVEAISLGAQDYHIKEDLDEKTLTKTILYSIERKRKLENLREDHERYVAINKAELDLLQSEEITRRIINSTLDAIICIDVYGKIIVWNPQAEKIFGWKQQEILERTLTETIIPPEYRERHEKGIKHYLATGEGPILNKLIEITAVDRAGDQFPVELTIIPLAKNGSRFFCAFIRDITERKIAENKLKRSEEQLLASIENTPNVAVQWYNRKGEVLFWNSASETMFGWKTAEALGKTTDKLFLTPEVTAGFLEAIKLIEETGQTIGPAEFQFHRRDGSEGFCVSTIFSIPSREGEPCFACMDVDITVRKKAEQELEDSYKAIRKLTEHLQNIREEERAYIAREIHDELGQQLTILKMDMSWINKKIGIQDEPVNTKMKDLLVMLDETIKSVRRISSELRPGLLDDLGLTAAMEWQLTEFEKRFGIKTHFKPGDTETKLPESIKTALFRIFQESLVNVARHSKAKKITVTLHMENDSIILSVVDNGVGFDKQDRIGKKALGILGMQERMSMIGGVYEISGKPGKGTRVLVTIPLGVSNKN